MGKVRTLVKTAMPLAILRSLSKRTLQVLAPSAIPLGSFYKLRLHYSKIDFSYDKKCPTKHLFFLFVGQTFAGVLVFLIILNKLNQLPAAKKD